MHNISQQLNFPFVFLVPNDYPSQQTRTFFFCSRTSQANNLIFSDITPDGNSRRSTTS
jgi:hypothetical protein